MFTSESAPALKLLGGAVIQTGDTPLGGPAAHRHRLALLALLAVSGRPMSRDKLVAFLWPERDTEHARNLLKTAVHELRKLLAENVILSIGDQLSIDPALLSCDVTEFEGAVAAKDYVRAASLYRGPFLDGFFLKDASEFEHWVDAKRKRLADTYARVIEHVPVETVPRGEARAAPPPADMAPGRIDRRWSLRVASVLALGVAAMLTGSTRAADRTTSSVTLAGAAPVILPDSEPGHALEFNGTTANASTRVGTIVTTQVDNIAYDMLVRFDGPTSHQYQMIFYNGHGAVTGWGLMAIGAYDGQAEGTIAVLAGGITISATPLVLKPGIWQHLSAERRGGKVTVNLDDQSYVVGAFPVNPLASAKYQAIERTTVGGDGTFDATTGHFRGAIDRVRIKDLASNFFIERWYFDEAKGAMTVGAKGAVIYLGNTRWTAAGRAEPRDVFWSRMQTLCGHAFGGRLTESSPADSVVRRSALVMHVRNCTPTEIRIPFHVGADRSRTWVLTRSATGFRLKHDHRHADGTEDAITQYGGDTRDSGSFGRQEFHADAHTAALIPAAGTNVWTLEIEPGQRFVYALRRVGTDRRFRVEFDLVKHVASPPPPWGATP
jgi:hypothetical protein